MKQDKRRKHKSRAFSAWTPTFSYLLSGTRICIWKLSTNEHRRQQQKQQLRVSVTTISTSTLTTASNISATGTTSTTSEISNSSSNKSRQPSTNISHQGIIRRHLITYHTLNIHAHILPLFAMHPSVHPSTLLIPTLMSLMLMMMTNISVRESVRPVCINFEIFTPSVISAGCKWRARK